MSFGKLGAMGRGFGHLGALGQRLKYLFNGSMTTVTADSTTITADNSR